MIKDFDVVDINLSKTVLDKETFEPYQFIDIKIRANYWACPPARRNSTYDEMMDELANVIKEKFKSINHKWAGLEQLPVNLYNSEKEQ